MSSGFVTESEVEAQKKRRQEEWDRVRKEDDPVVCPEPEDTRSLFERLQEQKMKVEAEKEEKHRQNNMVKTLESDEVEFLDFVDQQKSEEEAKKLAEEKLLLEDLKEYDEKIATREVLATDTTKAQSAKPVQTFPKGASQKDLLKNAIKRKSTPSVSGENGEAIKQSRIETTAPTSLTSGAGALQVAGVLPGLASYDDWSGDSSDSMSSSDSGEDPLLVSKERPEQKAADAQ